jgi:hypothetical protein
MFDWLKVADRSCYIENVDMFHFELLSCMYLLYHKLASSEDILEYMDSKDVLHRLMYQGELQCITLPKPGCTTCGLSKSN